MKRCKDGHSPETRSLCDRDLFPNIAKNWHISLAARVTMGDGFLTRSSSMNYLTLIRAREFRRDFCFGLIGVIKQCLSCVAWSDWSYGGARRGVD